MWSILIPMVLGVCYSYMLLNVGGKRSLCMGIPHGKISKIPLSGPIYLLPYLANTWLTCIKKPILLLPLQSILSS